MKSLFIIVFATFVLFLTSCTETTNSPEARLVTEDQLMVTPGFQWIPFEMDSYTPDAQVIESIKANFNASTTKIYLYGEPTCTCPGEHKDIAFLFRILQDADIPSDNLEILVLGSVNDKHPHQDLMVLNELPSFFVVRDEKVNSVRGIKKLEQDRSLERAFLIAITE